VLSAYNTGLSGGSHWRKTCPSSSFKGRHISQFFVPRLQRFAEATRVPLSISQSRSVVKRSRLRTEVSSKKKFTLS
jgi:hypothetical protein